MKSKISRPPIHAVFSKLRHSMKQGSFLISTVVIICLCSPTEVSNFPGRADFIADGNAWVHFTAESTVTDFHLNPQATDSQTLVGTGGSSYRSTQTAFRFENDSVTELVDVFLFQAGVSCGPYVILHGDTVPGDSFVCGESWAKREIYRGTLKLSGTWTYDGDSIHLHFTNRAVNMAVTQIDSAVAVKYSFTNGMDTLFIWNDTEAVPFVRGVVW